jgi:hypothetical protein
MRVRRAGEGDSGRDEGAAVGRAVDAEFAVEGGEPVRQPDETAPVRPGASHAIVLHLDPERAVLDPRRYLGVSGVSVFGDVGERFGDDEVFEMAVATSSVKAAILDSASSGSGRSFFEEAIIAPQGRWSTTIGAPTDERRPSSRPSAAPAPEACS